MADLTSSEKRKLEKLFDMSSGYVLGNAFSNRTFGEFVEEKTGRDIYTSRYELGSGSKAYRLRAFWTVEGNHLVGKLLNALIDHGYQSNLFRTDTRALQDDCLRIAFRLKSSSPVVDTDAFTASVNERDFETVAKQVREAIDKDQPEAGLDRLHTFVIKYVRTLCNERGIEVSRTKPLHSCFGEYVKALRVEGHLDSTMTERILTSTISILEAFNSVRNNQSLAHDNPILNYDESLLIFSHVASSICFIRNLEQRIKIQASAAAAVFDDEIPF